MSYRSLVFSIALAGMAGFGLPALAETPTAASVVAYQQTAEAYRLPLGRLEIIALSDGTVPQDLHQLLTHTTVATVDGLLSGSFLSNPVEASINAYLIRDGARRILVDTGSGQLFGPGYGGKLVDSLASVATKPEDITDILITHVHTDHTGGLVADGRMTFPNATVHVGKPDLDFFLDPSNAAKTGYDKHYFDEAAKTIGIYDKAGKVQPFNDGATILPGIVATIHPGHTPGSAFYTVTSESRSIVFVGDIVHVAAVQFPDPKITIVYDVDAATAASVRENAFSHFAHDRQLIAAPHLPFPGIGHVSANGHGAFSWFPVEYRNRAGQ
jgi:glyoxylase-like metal-dependent hydrolase (beta-lactamase superfamily II)